MRFIAPLFLLLALWTPVTAAQDGDRFQVEVIVFAQDDPWGAEQPHRQAQLAFPSRLQLLEPAQRLFRQPSGTDSLDERLLALMVPETFLTREEAGAEHSFRPLPESERQLDPEAYTLGRSGHYRVLFHEAWRQRVRGRDNAPWVLVSGGRSLAEDHPEMAGALRIYQGRFVHVQADLWRAAETMTNTADDGAGNPIVPPAQGVSGGIALPRLPRPAKSAQWQQLQRIQMPSPTQTAARGSQEDDKSLEQRVTLSAVDLLRQRVQLKEGRLQYLDHPRLGVLVLVQAIDDENTPGADDGDGES